MDFVSQIDVLQCQIPDTLVMYIRHFELNPYNWKHVMNM